MFKGLKAIDSSQIVVLIHILLPLLTKQMRDTTLTCILIMLNKK